MKALENPKFSFVLEDNQKIYKEEETEEEINIYIETIKHECECPECHAKTSKRIATRERIIKDTPIMNKKVQLHIKVGEYQCENQACKRNLFNEELELVEQGQRRTKRLNEFILAGSAFQSAKSAELTLSMQGVAISHDSIQRLFGRVEFKDRPDVKRIGIDEVAIKKGHKYATVIYDYDDGTLLTLINGRRKEDILPWLRKHQNIEWVARDRSSSYSSAISEALPNAKQVADRFHLFENLDSALEKFEELLPKKTLYVKDDQLLEEKPKTKSYFPTIESEKLEGLSYDNSPPIDENGKEIHFDNKIRDLKNSISKKQAEKRKEKKELVETIRADYFSHPDITYQALAKKYGKGPNTISKYCRMTQEEVEALLETHQYKKRRSRSDDYINIIYKMLRDGHRFSTIASYISQQDFFNDTTENLMVTIRIVAKNNFENWKSLDSNDSKIIKLPEGISTLKKSDIIKLIYKNDRSEREEKILQQVIEKYPIYGDLKEIYETFHSVVMSQGELDIDEFIKKYSCVLPTFCKGLQEDSAAVYYAITSPMSSGLVEGNNNKVKLIKRILYGRSGLVNLRIRCAVAFMITHEGFKFSDYLRAA